MAAIARLFLPPPSLCGLLAVGVMRDTRTADLAPNDRYNHFPATPLCTVTWVLAGDISLPDHPSQDAAQGSVMPRICISGPSQRPVISWNPGPVLAFSLAFYPDAWNAICALNPTDLVGRHICAETLPEGPLRRLVLTNASEIAHLWDTLLVGFSPLWSAHRPKAYPGMRSLQDWSRHLALRAWAASPGQSVRQVQRRVKAIAGQSQRGLAVYSRLEALQTSYPKAKSLANLAAEHGYADQSHMGREVKRLTGASPAQIRDLIADAEAFWPYRLLSRWPASHKP